MNEKQLLQFIERLVACQDKDRVRLSLNQLQKIMELNQIEEKYIQYVKELAGILPETTELGDKVKQGQELTQKDLDIAIRRGKDRLRREEEARRNNRC